MGKGIGEEFSGMMTIDLTPWGEGSGGSLGNVVFEGNGVVDGDEEKHLSGGNEVVFCDHEEYMNTSCDRGRNKEDRSLIEKCSAMLVG
jgi:hypothetical protein